MFLGELLPFADNITNHIIKTFNVQKRLYETSVIPELGSLSVSADVSFEQKKPQDVGLISFWLVCLFHLLCMPSDIWKHAACGCNSSCMPSLLSICIFKLYPHPALLLPRTQTSSSSVVSAKTRTNQRMSSKHLLPYITIMKYLLSFHHLFNVVFICVHIFYAPTSHSTLDLHAV